MSLKKIETVVQSNKLVQAHYRLTLQEKRLILWLIKEIDRHDEDFKEYRLTIAEFSKMLDLHPNTQYKEMKQVTKSLIGRAIEIENIETGATMQMAWLYFAHWEPKKGVCTMKFAPELRPYLLQLQGQFTEIGFADLMGLRSVYSVRIFELLMQYRDIGERTTTVKDLKAWCGIEKDEYKLYAHLKARIIDRAKAEINEKTEYEIDYAEIKESREIVALKWTFKRKTHFEKFQSHKSNIISDELTYRKELVEQVQEYGVSKQGAARLLDKHGQKIIADALEAVEKYRKKNDVKNAKAILLTAIKEAWKP